MCGGLVVAVLALMLWLPWGQYPFLIHHWMKVGTFLIPFVLLMALSYRRADVPLLTDPKTASALMFAAYLCHQFEEHWIDALGNHYAFFSATNEMLNNLLGSANQSKEILTPEAIFIINTSLVWMVGAIAIWGSANSMFPSLALAGITLVNGLTHIAAAIVMRAYNPGLVTAILIFIPLAGNYYLRTLKRLPHTRALIKLSLAWAVLAHVLMVGGIVLMERFKSIPQTTYFALLILWSFLPAVALHPSLYGKQQLSKDGGPSRT